MEVEAAKVIGAGLAVIGMIGSGIGIGSVFSSFIIAVGRNPAAKDEVFTMTMLGFALVEAIALFADLSTSETFEEFLTLPAYGLLDEGEARAG